MVFRVQDYQDLVRLLSEHPEWREELRRQLLSDDFLALPGIVRELAEAQRRTEERLDRLEAAVQGLLVAVQGLAEAQRRTEERLDRLEAAVQGLQAAVQGLAEAQRRTEETVHLLADRQGHMRGDLLELKYAARAAAYFGRLLQRIRTVLPGRLPHAVEDSLQAHLSDEELADVLQLDVLVVGRLRQPTTPEEAELWLAVEVSAGIDRGDVEQAQRRAALLRKAGYRVIPVVAGEGLTQGATQLLQDAPVALVLDGRSQGWEEALAVA